MTNDRQPSEHSGEAGESQWGGDELPVIEGYGIVDLIGRGGMGAVYEAFQDSTGRRVAVKLMLERAGATEAARRRFEREVELVARLSHPGIVSVLDSGVHRGRYFYVMEYVEGRPLDDAMPPGTCDPRAALAVLAKVARAVEYAHQRGVMHRDLKPGNILVDARGEPRLLDFGLAKAFDPNSLIQVRNSISEPGQVIGTLGYMSPEQARGAVGEVSVRSDVYSLGAIGYEMLCGQLPCAIDGPMAVVFQRIESRDPDRPSSIRKGIDADVDAILLKALEKSPDGRYANAGEFADDLERWLDGRPVRARRVSMPARVARWCRRNPVAAGAIGVAMLLVVSSSAALMWRIERERAVAAANESDDRLLTTVFTFDPDTNPGMIRAARIALEQVEASLRNTPRPPEQEADWRERIGELYRKIGDIEQARRNHDRALALQQQLRAGPNEHVARCLRNLGAVEWDRRRFAEAEEYYRRALVMRRSLHPTGDDPGVADSLNHLAQTLGRLRKFDEAVALQHECVEMRRRLFGERHESFVAAQNNLGTILMLKGDYEGAEQRFRSAMAAFIEIKGTDEHRFVAISLRNIAVCMMERGRYEGVEPLLIESQRIASAVLEAEHPITLAAAHDLARLRLEEGRLAEAESLGRDLLARRLRRLGTNHPDTASSRLLLGRILTATDEGIEAEKEIRTALEVFRGLNPVMPADVAEAQAALGAALLGEERAADALPLLLSACEVLDRERGPDDSRTRRCRRDLIAAQRSLGSN